MHLLATAEQKSVEVAISPRQGLLGDMPSSKLEGKMKILVRSTPGFMQQYVRGPESEDDIHYISEELLQLAMPYFLPGLEL